MDIAQLQHIVGTDRYRIEKLLGRGGMSTVWLATDLAAGRQVAIKLLNQELGDNPEFRQRFRNEASAARSVDSPNVVSIDTYQEGAAEGHGACYIVMEFIRGESLSEVLRRRTTLPEHLALDVVEQTAHGLSAIHAANLIHRDIKPGNLLVTPEGTVKITDFGIAKAAEAVPLTRTGMVVGTAQYVSPEQAQGKQVQPSTDIYSLGCVAYEMLAGRRPFQGDSTVAVAVAHINEPPQPLPPTVHPHIRELVGIMLRKDPQRRYADGRELARAVRAVRNGSRPPQPKGVQPTVYKQSNAANPATSELGAMTRPGMQTRAPGIGPTTNTRVAHTAARPMAPRPATRSAQRPAPRPSARPTPRPVHKKKNGLGCAVLFILLALLAAAVAIVISMLQGNEIPGLDNSTSSTEQTTEDQNPGYSWNDNSGTDGGWGTGGDTGAGTDTDTGSGDTGWGGNQDSGTDSGNTETEVPAPDNSTGDGTDSTGNSGNSDSGNGNSGNDLPSLDDLLPDAVPDPAALGNGVSTIGGAF
ncbi:serine/threonine-protein kinase [Corynebacterium sp. H78]|uniref:serine/threonine-protein kinase n=1 Tax=Corynebacterium sp. H78 TaxID=3133417 RepID=UPI0030987666